MAAGKKKTHRVANSNKNQLVVQVQSHMKVKIELTNVYQGSEMYTNA